MKYSIRLLLKNNETKTIKNKDMVDAYGMLLSNKNLLIKKLLMLIHDKTIDIHLIEKIFIDKIDKNYGIINSDEYSLVELINKYKTIKNIVDKIDCYFDSNNQYLYRYDVDNIKNKVFEIITAKSKFDIKNIVVFMNKQDKNVNKASFRFNNNLNNVYQYIVDFYTNNNIKKIYVSFIGGGGYCLFFKEDFDDIKAKLTFEGDFIVLY